jgi:hypothetical protein
MAFIRDTSSSAIINTDDSYYKSILAERSARKERDALCAELDHLRDELNDIRSLLKQVMTEKK